MGADATVEFVEAMRGRRQQLWLRLVMGLVIAGAFAPSLGLTITGPWYLVWAALELIEARWTIIADRASRRGSVVRVRGGLSIVLIENTLFATLGLAAILSGDIWLMVCGIWLLAGALLNACASSGASSALFWAGSGPALLGCLGVLIVAFRDGAPAAQLAALAVSAVLLLVAAIVLRGVGVRALLAAKEASASKGEFMAHLSHEIRTPLNGIMGMAQAMAAGELGPDQRERLELINRSGRALLVLLNDVLDLSKIEAGKLEIEARDFDLAQLAGDLARTFDTVSTEKGVAVRTVIDPTINGLWRGDEARTRQIVTNLLSNAVKFTREGAVALEVGLRKGGVELAVRDSGIGIPADRLQSVFEKYEQASAGTSREYGGTGLGLAICRELAARMGGELSAESTPGVGSTFRLWLPLEPAQIAPPQPVPTHNLNAVDLAPLRVLAAEDHPINQKVLGLMLEQLKVDVVLVEDGAAAVEAWRSQDWDLILMDVQMPVMDGPAAVRIIRDEERRTGRVATPIIALTANTMDHQIAHYLDCGMSGFLAKPLEFGRLAEALANAGEASAIGSAPVAQVS